MSQSQKSFAELVEDRLKQLGKKAATVERETGLAPDTIRNVLRSKSKSGPHFSTARQIAEALGLQVYVGPVRVDAARNCMRREWRFSNSDTRRHIGFAKCGLDGWADATYEDTPLPAPEWLDDPDAFYVTAQGQSMMPEGIETGHLCLVSPATPLKDGDRVWLKDHNGKQAIKRLLHQSDTSLLLRGWQPIFDKRQTSFEDERFLDGLKAAHPVVAVFRQGEAGLEHVPDPKHPPSADRVDAGLPGISLDASQAAHDPGQLAATGQIPSDLGFPANWLSRRGVAPSHAALLYVDGDAMAPTLCKGAIALVDHNRTTLRPRRIYAFRLGGTLQIRRLEKVGDQVVVSCDNVSHQTRLISGAELDEFSVIGEVIWSGRDW